MRQFKTFYRIMMMIAAWFVEMNKISPMTFRSIPFVSCCSAALWLSSSFTLLPTLFSCYCDTNCGHRCLVKIYSYEKMDGPNVPAFLQVLMELMDQNNDVRSSAEVCATNHLKMVYLDVLF